MLEVQQLLEMRELNLNLYAAGELILTLSIAMLTLALLCYHYAAGELNLTLYAAH